MFYDDALTIRLDSVCKKTTIMALHVNAILLVGVVLFAQGAIVVSQRPGFLESLRSAQQQRTATDSYIEATCVMQSNPGLSDDVRTANNIQGTVSFKQLSTGGNVQVSVDVTGIDPNSVVEHGFHVHEYGDLSDGCASTGGHFNPYNKQHGAPSDENRHAGDFGNLERDASGNIDFEFTDHVATLLGLNTIIGKAIVLHKETDDLGRGGDDSSLANGNAGLRLACCVITPKQPAAGKK